MKVKSEYPVITLGKLAEKIDYGFSASATDVGDGPKFLRITDIQDDHVNWLTVPLCEADKQDTIKYALAEGDIVFARTGATTGKSYLIRHCPQNSIFASYLIRVRPSKDVDSGYLSRFFQTSSYWRQINLNTSGTAQGGVNATKLKTLLVPLPPLEEQRRIAAILDKADGVRRKRKEAIRLTEELLKSTFLEMFGDPVTNPKGWEIAKLGDFGKILTGNTPPRSVSENYGDEIEWIKSDNITTPEHFLTEAEEKLSAKGKKIARTVPNGSVLVTCIAGSRSSIGRAALTDREVAFNQQINAVVPNSDVDPYFLYGQLFVAQHLVQAQSTDSMKGMVNKSKFSSIEFIKPPSQKQQKFGKWFLGFHRYYMNLISGEEQSENLFNSLLQKAFRGEL
ncbi:MAG: restriction endonuclease subunit S [Microcystis flos-aquae Mf_WU_F_19750830_S460]|uniref:Restriction endonuclease subunit S n=2 Tax=Microcystis TaxID=1125 RepID=A0A552LEB0_9CHRO|nr:MAG: restriction endonuclease subunit S [Microcystis flos-aquae Mf_WU_F_19750830_S460]